MRFIPGTQASSHEQDSMQPPNMTVELSIILKELRDFRCYNKSELEDIKEEIASTNSRLEVAENWIVIAEARIQNTEVLVVLLKLHAKMEKKLMDVEGCSRQDNIRIFGVPEGVENDFPMMAWREASQRKSKSSRARITPNWTCP